MKLFRKTLRLIKRAADKLSGTKADEWYWRFRHLLGKKERAWAKNYLSLASPQDPQRQLLIQRMAAHQPIENVLEIGCASGPNLFALGKEFPQTQFIGIDISSHAIQVGASWLNSHNLKNVKLFTGQADDLKRFPDKSIDIIFTVATLIYIGPDKINRVIDEMLRVASKAIILIEWKSEEEQIHKFDHWAYNWESLLKKHGAPNTTLMKLPSEDQSGGWKELGCVVEVPIGI
jgi:ubiquinone/menaquinone biosynthesis C-methylase UbiE